MAQQWFAALFHRHWRRGLMRSGMVTGLILGLVVAGLGVAYREHRRGNLHKLKVKIESEPQEAPVPRPGGQVAIVMTRSLLMGSSMPEFLSVTMLPGRGMNVLQITANIPGMGKVNLLASPSVEDAAGAMSGTDADADGQASLTMGGAFEIPWAGRIWGAPSQAAGRISTVWRGHSMTLPASGNSSAGADAQGGLLLAEAADSAETTVMPDGGQTQAVFHSADFDARWPSKTDVTVTVQMDSRSINLTVLARNTGDVPEPVGIGWHPRFAVQSGNREQMRLRLPAERRIEVHDRKSGLPTGVLLPVSGTAYDFTMPGGEPLGKMDLDDCFVALHREMLDNGQVAELSDPAGGYGLRLTALSSTIQAMRVVAQSNSEFVSIEPQFNFDDPFGREWGSGVDTGMVLLQPGQSTQWKARLEIFSLVGSQSAK
jgi:galactose mutarotase-like enzyme